MLREVILDDFHQFPLVDGEVSRKWSRRIWRRTLASGSRPRYGRTVFGGKQTVYGSAARAPGLQRLYIQYDDWGAARVGATLTS
jgi:hypothetical protein